MFHPKIQLERLVTGKAFQVNAKLTDKTVTNQPPCLPTSFQFQSDRLTLWLILLLTLRCVPKSLLKSKGDKHVTQKNIGKMHGQPCTTTTSRTPTAAVGLATRKNRVKLNKRIE